MAPKQKLKETLIKSIQFNQRWIVENFEKIQKFKEAKLYDLVTITEEQNAALQTMIKNQEASLEAL